MSSLVSRKATWLDHQHSLGINYILVQLALEFANSFLSTVAVTDSQTVAATATQMVTQTEVATVMEIAATVAELLTVVGATVVGQEVIRCLT